MIAMVAVLEVGVWRGAVGFWVDERELENCK